MDLAVLERFRWFLVDRGLDSFASYGGDRTMSWRAAHFFRRRVDENLEARLFLGDWFPALGADYLALVSGRPIVRI
jgi:hypothetical protein